MCHCQRQLPSFRMLHLYSCTANHLHRTLSRISAESIPVIIDWSTELTIQDFPYPPGFHTRFKKNVSTSISSIASSSEDVLPFLRAVSGEIHKFHYGIGSSSLKGSLPAERHERYHLPIQSTNLLRSCVYRGLFEPSQPTSKNAALRP